MEMRHYLTRLIDRLVRQWLIDAQRRYRPPVTGSICARPRAPLGKLGGLRSN